MLKYIFSFYTSKWTYFFKIKTQTSRGIGIFAQEDIHSCLEWSRLACIASMFYHSVGNGAAWGTGFCSAKITIFLRVSTGRNFRKVWTLVNSRAEHQVGIWDWWDAKSLKAAKNWVPTFCLHLPGHDILAFEVQLLKAVLKISMCWGAFLFHTYWKLHLYFLALLSLEEELSCRSNKDVRFASYQPSALPWWITSQLLPFLNVVWSFDFLVPIQF